MSKELTEQWRNETLEEGWYYVLYVDGSDSDCDYWNGLEWHFDYPPVKEVLAPVPTYDQFVELTEKSNQFSQMEKKVHILNEANMNLKNVIGNFAKQLKEAERLLVELHWQVKGDLLQRSIDYFEKYGVEK